ncbi:MAG TPA: FAD-binding oxidoreductase [Methylomirabilota bacterium]|nr:FAD-binding oxidoreductase [Methylomirabilota bacterium]
MSADRVFEGRGARVPAGPWDVIVVGAGIYGLPTAFFLAKHHRARVLVVEDNTIPGECITVNTGGIIRIAYSDLDVMRVAALAREIYRDPTRRLGLSRPVHLGFVPTGWGRFVSDTAVPGILREVMRIAQGADGRLRVVPMGEYLAGLPPGRRRNVERVMDAGDSTHVLADDEGGFADGGTALAGFYEACLEAGVCVSLYSTVSEFLREGERVTGLVLERWSEGGTGREVVAREAVRADRIVLAAGRDNGALVRRAAGWEMPTFTSFHQVPYIRNSPDNDFAQTQYRVGRAGAQRDVELIDLPTISHWRDIYFRPEGSGLIFGTHHRLLQPDDYRPTGGVIGGMRVGLDQVMIDTLLEVMAHFPVLGSQGLNLGRTPADIAGGAYYMNPEELPFEGEVPGTGGRVFYAGSGCGTGFKLGPGVAWLLVQRLAGVPRENRLIPSTALSAERATYFYPPGTSREELVAQFRPAAEGGRLVEMGAAGIAAARPSGRERLHPGGAL